MVTEATKQAEDRLLAVEQSMVMGDEQNVQAQKGLATTTHHITMIIGATIASAVVYAVGTVWHAYQQFNTPEMGHMISIIDEHKQSGQHGGLAYALAFNSGLWREFFFYGQTQLPLAVVMAFASETIRPLFVQDVSGNINKLKGLLESGSEIGVDVMLCSLFKQVPSCQSVLCPNPNSRKDEVAKASIQGAAGGIGIGMMMAQTLKMAGPQAAVAGMIVGVASGAGMGYLASNGTKPCQ